MTILTAEKLAMYLDIGISSAYKILESGQLPTIYIGTLVRVVAEEVDAYLLEHRNLYITGTAPVSNNDEQGETNNATTPAGVEA